MLARQPQAQIILGQQHAGQCVADGRLVFGDPQDFGRGKAGKHDVPGQAAEHRVAVQLGRLFMAAGVVPQDAGAQHLVGFVEQGRAMHLARKTDPAHRTQTMGRQLVQHGFGGGDPIAGGLFAPPRMGA